jgi:phage terminase small subunit
MSAKRAGASSSKLTPKQQRFVEEYLVDLNGTQAAMRSGYSARTADRIAHELLRKPAVAAAVAERMRARSERVGASSEWVLRRLYAEAEADLADLYDEQGNLKHPDEWPAIWRTGLVAGIETFQAPTGEVDADGKRVYGTVRKLKLADRTRIVELIGKHAAVSAFREQIGLSNPDGGPIEVAAVPLDNIKKALARVRALSEQGNHAAPGGDARKGEE